MVAYDAATAVEMVPDRALVEAISPLMPPGIRNGFLDDGLYSSEREAKYRERLQSGGLSQKQAK